MITPAVLQPGGLQVSVLWSPLGGRAAKTILQLEKLWEAREVQSILVKSMKKVNMFLRWSAMETSEGITWIILKVATELW